MEEEIKAHSKEVTKEDNEASLGERNDELKRLMKITKSPPELERAKKR